MAQAPNGATGIGCSCAHVAPLGVLWDLCPAIHGLTPMATSYRRSAAELRDVRCLKAGATESQRDDRLLPRA